MVQARPASCPCDRCRTAVGTTAGRCIGIHGPLLAGCRRGAGLRVVSGSIRAGTSRLSGSIGGRVAGRNVAETPQEFGVERRAKRGGSCAVCSAAAGLKKNSSLELLKKCDGSSVGTFGPTDLSVGMESEISMSPATTCETCTLTLSSRPCGTVSTAQFCPHFWK